jgi:hypothetical protein
VRVLQRDLPVVGAVRDQERHGDLLDDAVEVDVVREPDELVQIVEAPDPEHVLPIVATRSASWPLAVVGQIVRTFSACGPFLPCVMSNSTRCASSSDL